MLTYSCHRKLSLICQYRWYMTASHTDWNMDWQRTVHVYLLALVRKTKESHLVINIMNYCDTCKCIKRFIVIISPYLLFPHLAIILFTNYVGKLWCVARGWCYWSAVTHCIVSPCIDTTREMFNIGI